MLFDFWSELPPGDTTHPADRALLNEHPSKLSGFAVPSQTNEAAFESAVEEVAASARRLIQSLVTSAEPRTREAEAAKARARSALRFGPRP